MPTIELNFVTDGDPDPEEILTVVQAGVRITPNGVEHWDLGSVLTTIAQGLYRADGSRIAGGA